MYRKDGRSAVNSTEKRLARTLLLLAPIGKQGQPQRVVPKVSPRDAGGNDRHLAFPVNLFIIIQEMGFIIPTRIANPQLALERSPARLGASLPRWPWSLRFARSA